MLISIIIILCGLANAVNTPNKDCRRSLLSPLTVKECKRLGVGISHEELLPSDTVCIVACSHTAWMGRGRRRCVNGHWEGSPIDCRERNNVRHQLSRRKRRKECRGQFIFKECRDVQKGGHLSCTGFLFWRACLIKYKPLNLRCYSPPSYVVYADKKQTSAKVTWRPPSYYGGGGRLTLTANWNLVDSGFMFKPGHHNIRYRLRDNVGSTPLNCFVNFIVKVRTCVVPNPPPFGSVRCTRIKQAVWGDECNVTCPTGDKISNGYSQITCMQNEQFDRETPSCEAIKCDTINSTVEHGYYKCPSDPKYDDICLLNCEPGFIATGVIIPRCDADGIWTTSAGICKDQEKPTFSNCPKSFLKFADKNSTSVSLKMAEIQAMDNSGYVVLKQISGPDINTEVDLTKGVHAFAFTATDKAGYQTPCEFRVTVEVLTCSVPDLGIHNMKYTCSHTDYILGSRCMLSCERDRQIIDDHFMTCERNETGISQTLWKINKHPTCTGGPCPEISPPRNGAITCDDKSVFCSVSCHENYDLPASTPTSFTCAENISLWLPSPNVRSCRATRPGRQVIKTLEAFMYYNGSCTEVKHILQQKFLQKLNSNKNRKIFCEVLECDVADNVNVYCGKSRKRRAIGYNTEDKISVTLDIKSKFRTINGSLVESLSFYEDQLNSIYNMVLEEMDNGEFDDLVPGVKVLNDSLRTRDSHIVCDEGLILNDTSRRCVPCPHGTVYDKTKNDCTACPRGTYQDEDAVLSTCKQCPTGTTTLMASSTHLDNCTKMCVAGEYSKTGAVPCSKCPPGTYQTNTNSTSCIPCAAGQTTTATGSTNLSNCTAFDMLMKDVQWIESDALMTSSSYDQFTILSSLKIENIANGGLILQLNQPDVESSFNIAIGQSSINVNGYNMSTRVPDDWFYLVVFVNLTVTEVNIYAFSSLTFSHRVDTATDVVNGARLRIVTDKDSVVTVRSLRVVPRLLTDDEVSDQLKTCSISSTISTPLLSLDHLNSITSSEIYIIVPSHCDDVDDCVPSPCNNNTCVNQVNGYTCHCIDGYTGVTCNIPPDYCSNQPCLHGATCLNSPLTNNYTCSCVPGYRGRLCATKIVNGGWSVWSDWSTCSVTCNGGISTKERICNNPSPDVDGLNCTGKTTQTQTCSTQPCPVCRQEDLQLAPGVARTDCTCDKHHIICTPICNHGFVFQQLTPSYECQGGDWLSGNITLPCKKVILQPDMKLKARLQYQVDDCTCEDDVVDQITILCVGLPYASKDSACSDKITTNSCTASAEGQVGRTLVVDILVSCNIPETSNKAEVVYATVEKLNRTYEVITQKDFFDVSIDGITHKGLIEISENSSRSVAEAAFVASGSSPAPSHLLTMLTMLTMSVIVGFVLGHC